MDNVLGQLFSGIADAIRSKTGETGTMKPAEFPDAIRGIEGKSPELRYVTFMSHDGSTEYGKKAVATGDNCADPVARGLFGKPTRESTAQYDYVNIGWSRTPNGPMDSDALNEVTEDRTVYACFAEVLRYYTITFYDGDSILNAESLPYGAIPDYSPEKSGHSFCGWEPELAMVTGDASYYAHWEENVTFRGSTWADISRVSMAGKASTYFSVGDTRTIPITLEDGTVKDVEFVVCGINHDDMEDGTKVGLSIISKRALYYDIIKCHPSTGIQNGWSGSTLRSNVAAAFDMLPDDLKPYIQPVTKLSGGPVSNNRALEETVDKIWVPSVTEYGVDYTYATAGQGTAYEWFTASGNRKADGLGKTAGASNIKHGTRSNCRRGNSMITTFYNGNVEYSGEIEYCRIGFCI